jgi:hypothetical protein
MRLAVLTLVAAATLAAGAGTALAAGESISITTSDGRSDPVAFIPRVFTVSGASAGPTYLFVKHRATGGAPCAPTPYADPGSSWTGFYALAVNGAFSFPKVITWDASGSWTFCFWLGPDERTISTPVAQTVLFRLPTGSMAASVAPLLIRPNQRARVTVTGTSEAARDLYAKVRRVDTGPCATSYDLDPGQSVISGENVNGTFMGDAITVQPTPGQYLVCAWLTGSSYDPTPIAIQSTTFNVVAKPPVLSSATVINCSTKRALRRFRAGSVRSVCMRYRFSTPPYAGQRVLVSYITPRHKTYKTVASRWPTGGAKSAITPSLLARGYKHRRGTWHAILRIAGQQVRSTAFRVT